MNPNVPFYITAMLFLIVAVLIWAIFYALNYAMDKLEIQKQNKLRALIITAVLLLGWLIVTSLIAFQGTLLDFTSTPPKLMIVIIPSVLAITYISSSGRVNNLLSLIPSSWFVYIQSFRVLMEIMLWLLFLGNIIPKQMTFEGLNYDVLVGLSAPLIAYYSLSQKKWPRLTAVLWNFAGLLLVTNIFLVALLSTPSPLRQFFNEPPNTIVAYFPFVWIPGFIVPFAYLMHVLSLKKILKYPA